MKKPVYYILLAVLLLAFAVSTFVVVNYLIQGKQKANQFDELSQLASNPPTTESASQTTVPTTQATGDPSEPTQETDPTEPTMIPGYEAVNAKNPDVVGWIRIDDTRVDYPVMHTPDRRDYYLKKDFDGNYSDWGCLYMREECDIIEPSDNITIYGHCMRDGSMFADLHNYTEKEFWQDHQLIYFDTLYEYHVYEIFAVFKTSANMGEGFQYHLMVDAEDETDFNDFISTCKELSFYDTGITPTYGDKIISLSTCEYTLDNGRLVVCARRIF